MSDTKPPMILGVELHGGIIAGSWWRDYGRLQVALCEHPSRWVARIDAAHIRTGTLADCVEAIERELLAVRAAIPVTPVEHANARDRVAHVLDTYPLDGTREGLLSALIVAAAIPDPSTKAESETTK